MRASEVKPSQLVAYLSVLCVSVSLLGCATVPKESVTLSTQIGAGISKARTAHLSTIDSFYGRLNKDSDDWVVNSYLPKLIGNSLVGIAAACKAKGDNSASCTTLNNGDIRKIIANAIQYRDEIHSALSKSRDEANRLTNEHYNDLLSANAGITALLASAVDVSKATKESVAVANRIGGVNIDTDAIEEVVEKYLEKAGTVGAQVTELEASLSSVLRNSDN